MEYFIVENGKQAGPFSIAQLAENISSQRLWYGKKVWQTGLQPGK